MNDRGAERDTVGIVGYAHGMDPRTGRVVNGAVVLDDATGLVDGTVVTVWIREVDAAFLETEEEREEINLGLRSAAEEPLVDARSFLAELRRSR